MQDPLLACSHTVCTDSDSTSERDSRATCALMADPFAFDDMKRCCRLVRIARAELDAATAACPASALSERARRSISAADERLSARASMLHLVSEADAGAPVTPDEKRAILSSAKELADLFGIKTRELSNAAVLHKVNTAEKV